MDPRINRHTGRPHLHLEERLRRARQLRHRMMRDLLIAGQAIAEVEHLFPSADSDSLARKLGEKWTETHRR